MCLFSVTEVTAISFHDALCIWTLGSLPAILTTIKAEAAFY